MLVPLVLLAAVGWGGEAPGPGPEGEPPPAAAGTVHEHDHVRDEAERILAFLRGEGALDGSLIADSVTLYIAPEGGGQQRVAPRPELAQRAAWRVGPYSLVPPAGLQHLTVAPGLHFDCLPGPLEVRYPALARRPHVGVRLARSDDAGCLQTWNLTFVFTDDPRRPLLSAVVYDQWEW
ncbi:MAG TPA: hypothetical protein VMN39_03510 [Longimicrobiaceae bacterium]|nr:hypothetical protein [Longimicrobiaceae bacterium]